MVSRVTSPIESTTSLLIGLYAMHSDLTGEIALHVGVTSLKLRAQIEVYGLVFSELKILFQCMHM